MKKLLIFLLSFILSYGAGATTYYFNSVTGNDANNGTSTMTPWQTIDKFNSAFATKTAGDVFLFNRGDVFYGTNGLRPSKSGTLANPFTIGAYGTGANPVITGFKTITGWTNVGGNVWESNASVSSLKNLNMVLINGVNVAMGRYPDNGYIPYQSTTTTTKTASGLPSGTTNWTGAIMVVRTRNWITEKDTITAHAGNVLTHIYHGTGGAGSAGMGLFIQNDVRTLTVQNEWYFNPSTKKLRIFSAAQPTNVQVATVDTLVSMGQKGFFLFDGVDFTGSNFRTFAVAGAANLTFQNCTFDYAGYDCFWGYANPATAPNFTLQNCTVNHTNNNVITFADLFTNAYIAHNSFLNTGMQPGMGGTGEDPSNGTDEVIQTKGAGTVIEYNTFTNVGYIPINFHANNVIVRFNDISNFDATKMDGGGVYTWNGDQTSSFNTGNKIYNNIIHDADGSTSLAGTTQVTSLVHGIYMDANTRNIEIYNNVIFNLGHSGIFFYSGTGVNNVHDNTVFNCAINQLLIYNFFSNSLQTQQNTFTANVFAARANTQRAASFEMSVALSAFTSDMGSWTGQYYIRPIADNTVIHNESGSGTVDRTVAQWQTISSNDAGAHTSPATIASVNDITIEYNATNATVVRTLAIKGVTAKNQAFDGSITLAAYSGEVLIKTGAATGGGGGGSNKSNIHHNNVVN